MGIFKFSLIFSIFKLLDKGFGVFRNYILSNYTEASFSDSFYMIMSLAEVFGNSALKTAEFESVPGKKSRNYSPLLFLVNCAFIALGIYLLFPDINHIILCVSLVIYVFFRAVTSYIKFSVSLGKGGMIEVLFSVVSTIVLTGYIYFSLDDEIWLFFLITIISASIASFMSPYLIFNSIKNVTEKVFLNKQFIVLLSISLVPFLEKMLYERLGEGVLTNFVIAYMLVSIPLVLLPVSTLSVIFNKFNIIKDWLVIPIQIMFVLVVSFLVYYLNLFYTFFPQFNFEFYQIGLIACLGNIMISYIETQFFIKQAFSLSVVLRKYSSLGMVMFLYYIGFVTTILELVTLVVFMNLVTLLPLFFIRQGKSFVS